jgi:RNA polymerase sigma-70 factor (ECF subfamily)
MTAMTETRSSLLRRVSSPTDTDGWCEFVELYEPLLLAYVQRHGLTEHDARDVVQDVFIALLRALPTFELDRGRGRFRTWLWQVTCHAVTDWQRRRDSQARAEAEWRQRGAALGPASAETPDAAWLDAYRQRVLEYVLERVRAQTQEKTWTCFEQHLLQGRGSAAVAAELDLTANAVCVNASRVLARVREQCAEYLEELGDEGDPLPGRS